MLHNSDTNKNTTRLKNAIKHFYVERDDDVDKVLVVTSG